MSFKYTAITKEAFDTVLSRYPSLVPPALYGVDTTRYEIIPDTLRERRDGMYGAYLMKEDVVSLVEWKLKHGTFRPKLLQLVKENTEELIEETTRKAFLTDAKDPSTALKILIAMKGIGPATASLLLSVNNCEEVPFFSDELFRWLMWDEKAALGGWKRAIKYNNKEYGEVVKRVAELRERLGVRADHCEKVAWVLGKEGVDPNSGAEPEVLVQKKEEEKKEARKVNTVAKNSTKQSKATPKEKGTKRKADEPKMVPERLRRSNRRKTETYYGEN